MKLCHTLASALQSDNNSKPITTTAGVQKKVEHYLKYLVLNVIAS